MEDEIDLLRIGAWVFVVGLVIGFVILGWIYLLGPLFNQANYNNYNSSPQHINAVVQKAADDCQQLAQTTDKTSRKAIEQDIYQLFSGIDLSKVQMSDGTRS